MTFYNLRKFAVNCFLISNTFVFSSLLRPYPDVPICDFVCLFLYTFPVLKPRNKPVILNLEGAI